MLRERFETADLINVIQLGTKRPLWPKYGNHFVVASLINPEHYAKPRKLSGEWRIVWSGLMQLSTSSWWWKLIVGIVVMLCQLFRPIVVLTAGVM